MRSPMSRLWVIFSEMFCLSLYDHRMAAMVPNIISSFDNIQGQKRNGEGISSYMCLFLSERKIFPRIAQQTLSSKSRVRAGSLAPFSPFNQSWANDYPALFSLPMIHPMEPKKVSTYPEHIAIHLNS